MKYVLIYREEEKFYLYQNNTRKRTIASIAVLVKFNQQMK